MTKTFVSIQIVLLVCLCTADALAQQTSSKDSAASADFARAQQFAALADSKQVDALDKLRQALSDPSWYVRGEAASALGKLGDKSASPFLAPLLHDQNWFVRNAAFEALTALGAAETVALRDLNSSADPYLRARAIVAEGRSGNSANVDFLIQALSDNDQLIRRTAATALGDLKAANAIDPLLALLKDDDQSVRSSAAVALGRIGDKRAVEPLQSTFSEAGANQWEYAVALYKLGKVDYLDQVTAALQSEYADVRRGAF